MKLRIGVDYTAAIHQSAGIGRYTRELVQALAGLAADIEVRLFAADARRAELPPQPAPNFSWHTTRLTERWLARLWFRLQLPLPINLWTGPLNLYHATDFFLPPLNRATKSLVTVHDLSFVRHPESVMPGMTRHLNTWVPRSVQRADHVIAVSEATRQDLIELYGTLPEKISVLYHGVSAHFKPITAPANLAQIRRKYGLGNAPFILSLGTIQPRKNYLRLVQAFARLNRDTRLVIVGGRGWDSAALLAEIDNLGLAGRVLFPGYAPDDDLPALYSAATLFVYPSLYEGFGLPALEAMACGTPVVASCRSALPEVVGQAGLLVNPEDVDEMQQAIAALLADDSRRARLAAAGINQAAKFTWPAMAGQLVQLYQRLAG
ncbi:MAG: D-inositol-3-phosphate glycosyltransferase [Anaerolineae bacterium]|nr:D-inositol-3-phosphate glycosyltransferase [Anaerolineae bacterium]